MSAALVRSPGLVRSEPVMGVEKQIRTMSRSLNCFSLSFILLLISYNFGLQFHLCLFLLSSFPLSLQFPMPSEMLRLKKLNYMKMIEESNYYSLGGKAEISTHLIQKTS